MKRKKQSESPFWRPQREGEKITDVFSHFTDTQTPDGKKGMGLVLSGGKIIPMSWQIVHALEPHLEELKPMKSKLTFVFLAQVNGKKGRKVNQYEVYLNDTQLETAGFAKRTSDDVKKWLASQK